MGWTGGNLAVVDDPAVRRRVLIWLLSLEAILGLMHAVTVWPEGLVDRQWIELFHVSREKNVPTGFSTLQWGLLGVVLALVARRSWDRPGGRLWLLGAAGAVFLGVDEFLLIHEQLGWALKDRVPALSEWRGYAWSFVYLPLVVPAVLALLWVLGKQLDRALRLRVAAGVGIFLAGALVLDFIEPLVGLADHSGVVLGSIKVDLQLIEELCEMVGVTVVLTTFLAHAAALGPLSREAPR